MTKNLQSAVDALVNCFSNGGKLLLCGNGGSAADCDHIAGELMKGFLKKRPLSEEEKELFDDAKLANTLQNGLPCINLTGHAALTTAFANDVDGEYCFAQQVHVYAAEYDVLLCISTSGNAKNVCHAAKTARAHGLTVIGMSGGNGGKLKKLCDVMLLSAQKETYKIQEDHVVLYHALCAAVEEIFFEE